MVNEAIKYVQEVLGIHFQVIRLGRERMQKIPMFLAEGYDFYATTIYGKELVLIEPKGDQEFSITQTEKHLNRLWANFGTVVLVLDQITTYTRKRMIENRINFIVPGKQLFLPELLIDLRENFAPAIPRRNTEKLLPSAQLMVLYHLLSYRDDNNWKLERQPFYEIAKRLDYTAMGITKAVENLKHQKLIKVSGEKEKQLVFKLHGPELWHYITSRDLWIDPVLKKVYADRYPQTTVLLANESALAQYSDMNPSYQLYYALGRKEFYELENIGDFTEHNGEEKKYCFEIWKYDPRKLPNSGYDNEVGVVDPLSLYLSLRHLKDERIEMALEHILEKYIW